MNGDIPLEEALDALDGDREAMPLVSLRKQKIAARDEALEALREARALASELEDGIRTLDGSIAELEGKIIALGDRDEEGTAEFVPASSADDLEKAREEHARIASGLRQARDRVRAVVAAGPGPAIPVEHMGPRFAAGATLRAAASSRATGVPGRLTPGTGIGVRNARAVAESMLERDRRGKKADEAGKRS